MGAVQETLTKWRAHTVRGCSGGGTLISIHTLREGGADAIRSRGGSQGLKLCGVAHSQQLAGLIGGGRGRDGDELGGIAESEVGTDPVGCGSWRRRLILRE